MPSLNAGRPSQHRDATTAPTASQQRRARERQPGEDLDFTQRLEACREAVDAKLASLLATSAGTASSGPLAEAMRYATLGGGKRFRPFLVLEKAALFDVPQAKALAAAAAVECIHCYSLVHDDLPAMDDDDLRRGRPTVHKAFDEATAILAGDGLLTLAFEILGAPATDPEPSVRADLVLGLAHAAGWQGMVGGQMLDLLAEHTPTDLEGVLSIQALKTGALIEFSVVAGALIGRAGTTQRLALARYARALGLAFQIADDLLDAEGDAAEVGKATAKDAASGKATLVSLLGIAASKAKLRQLEAEAIAALEPWGARAEVLREAARFVVDRRS
jgi:farnesyl diphosphate synthase